MADSSLPWVVYRSAVLPDWVDFNGHMRDAFYMVLFSQSVDAVMDAIGLDEAGRAATNHTLFTLEAHVNFLGESIQGEALEVHAQVLGLDAKRLHIGLSCYAPGGHALRAFSEQMLMNVDRVAHKSAPWNPAIGQRLNALADSHRTAAWPKYAGRTVALPQP